MPCVHFEWVASHGRVIDFTRLPIEHVTTSVFLIDSFQEQETSVPASSKKHSDSFFGLAVLAGLNFSINLLILKETTSVV